MILNLSKKKIIVLLSLGVLVIVIVLLAVFLSKGSDEENGFMEPVIYTTSGRIDGVHHGHYYSFESIPYAEPPIGPNRFESPIPYKSKSSIDGTKSSPICMQWRHEPPNNTLEGQEDCLFINVYTPSLGGTKLYPIIIFIHGGGFTFGNGGTKIRPLTLMKEKNVVMVAMNYRLGPLGFLSTEDEEISGNMGLKDQHLALQWIKKNALAFNGDPNSILLTGFSAGGASVHFHLLSQKTTELGLASAAISFSGTANCPWVLVPKPLERTKRLAALLNCTIGTTNSLKKCLKELPAEEIVKAVKNFQPYMFYPFRIFGPVIESNSVKDAFITQHPNEIIKTGNFSKLPFLISNTKDEGGYNAADLMMKRNDSTLYLEEFLQRFDELAPQTLYYGETMTEQETTLYTQYLKERYQLLNNDSWLDKYMRLQEIFSLNLYLNDARTAVQLHRDYGTKAVYRYLYENPAPRGVGNRMSLRDDINFGTVHGDDNHLIFGSGSRDGIDFRPDEEIISRNLIKMIRNFAITGKLVYDDIDVPQNIPNLKKIIYLSITREKSAIIIEDD